MTVSKLGILVLSALLISSSAHAEIRLPALVGNGMVLQQKTTVTLWGWCDPGEQITVRTGWDTTTYKTVGTPGAGWRIEVRTAAAGGPFTIRIRGNNEVLLQDVLLGEVWLCSGQSNMQWSQNDGLRYEDEARTATDTALRLFLVPRSSSLSPQDDLKARWARLSSESFRSFSAVGYFFAKSLRQKLGVPVGIISAAWGGSPADIWAPGEAIRGSETLRTAAAALKPSTWWPIDPGSAYNAMIHPMKSYAIAGALWYQGESNVDAFATYAELLRAMIGSWRRDFGAIPFYIVQIAPWTGYANHRKAALLREAQAQVGSDPGNGFITIHDLVDTVTELHPKQKREVGERLALLALGDHYKTVAEPFRSPRLESFRLEKSRAILSIRDAGTGLRAVGGAPCCFELAAADGKFYPADARIEGATISLQSKWIPDPKYIRYGFSNEARPNVTGSSGLPLTTFRTDTGLELLPPAEQ